MKLLPRVVEFDWDQGNFHKNLIKHAVTNKESEEVFKNEPNFILKDEKHSLDESRYMIWGFTDSSRKLAVFFTIRQSKVRIISARDMHKKERKKYEKEI